MDNSNNVFICQNSSQASIKLKWSTHTDGMGKKAQQHLFNLRRLKKFVLAPKTLTNLYRYTIESILSGCITIWYGNCMPATAGLSRGWHGLPNASPGANYLPSRTPTAPDNTGITKRSSRTTTTRGNACSPRYHLRLKNSFYLKAIRLLNSHHYPATQPCTLEAAALYT